MSASNLALYWGNMLQ